MPGLALDHLVYVTRDLESAVDELEGILGIKAAPGGRHPGRGTRNALLALGEERYLEIIGPDPEQKDFRGPRGFDIDSLDQPCLRTWAVKAPQIDRHVTRARAAGYDPGEIIPRSRVRPDGVTLRWKLTTLGDAHPNWLVPFLIDWGDSPHPSRTTPAGIKLVRLRGEHPAPARITSMLAALGVELQVSQSSTPRLVATLGTPRGPIELA
ncbi:MAG: VOC family protein [Chloroflexi bacterium]|nr:VOC family protein [Chloroflexota bacterium]